jgi:hypothetical protein
MKVSRVPYANFVLTRFSGPAERTIGRFRQLADGSGWADITVTTRSEKGEEETVSSFGPPITNESRPIPNAGTGRYMRTARLFVGQLVAGYVVLRYRV